MGHKKPDGSPDRLAASGLYATVITAGRRAEDRSRDIGVFMLLLGGRNRVGGVGGKCGWVRGDNGKSLVPPTARFRLVVCVRHATSLRGGTALKVLVL
ncbi:hypothetical protein BaRGS_00025978 [Batillaria attramentaria]|uniref:Uncharacterized protein n=1 Tax=Batillaria attramentaria TaxID=370345 RepID=A0ABD0K5U2_9CAEN